MEIGDQFRYRLKNRSEKWGAPILEPPDGDDDESRRQQFVEQHFHDAKSVLANSLPPSGRVALEQSFYQVVPYVEVSR